MWVKNCACFGLLLVWSCRFHRHISASRLVKQEEQRSKANSQTHEKIRHSNIPQTWQMMILSCCLFVFHQRNSLLFKRWRNWNQPFPWEQLWFQLFLICWIWYLILIRDQSSDAWGGWTHVKLLDDLLGGFVEPLFLADLWLLLQVRGVGRTRLSLHFGVFWQFQLFKALKLWDP